MPTRCPTVILAEQSAVITQTTTLLVDQTQTACQLVIEALWCKLWQDVGIFGAKAINKLAYLWSLCTQTTNCAGWRRMSWDFDETWYLKVIRGYTKHILAFHDHAKYHLVKLFFNLSTYCDHLKKKGDVWLQYKNQFMPQIYKKIMFYMDHCPRILKKHNSISEMMQKEVHSRITVK